METCLQQLDTLCQPCTTNATDSKAYNNNSQHDYKLHLVICIDSRIGGTGAIAP